jgi:hypothetical protein
MLTMSSTIQPSNPHETMGSFLGLSDQKSRAEAKYFARADLAGDDVKSTTDSGEPTCAVEDHSFMGTKPGGADTLPGWGTMKSMFENLK